MKRFLKRTTALIVAVAMSAILTPELDTIIGDKVWAEENNINDYTGEEVQDNSEESQEYNAEYQTDVAVPLSDDISNVEFAGGDGSVENPYQVSTAEQLNAVRNDRNANYIQISDIDLSVYSNWEPIGEGDEEGLSGGVTDPFNGSYNGNGYKINNLTILNSSRKYVGLFGYAPQATLSNISLVNISIDIDLIDKDFTIGSTSTRNVLHLGCIAGGNNNIISGCSSSGNISVNNAYNCYIGGIVGSGFSAKSINNTNISVVSNRDGQYANDSTVYAGGIVGSASNISECLNYGNIDVTAGKVLHLGGIIGDGGSISYCINYGNIKGTQTRRVDGYLTTSNCNVGGISGKYNGKISYCANLGDIYALSNTGSSRAAQAGGISAIAGHESSTMVYLLPISDCYNAADKIDAIAHKENDGVLEPFYVTANRIATIVDQNKTSECYSLDSTLVNGVIVSEDIGTNQKNGESADEAFINEKISEILSVIKGTSDNTGDDNDNDFEDNNNDEDYTQYLQFELNDGEIIKFDYKNGEFNPISKTVNFSYGAYLIDTSDKTYGNDVILTNVTIKITAPEGISFDEAGNVTEYTETFKQLRLNTNDCSGTFTLYLQEYTKSTVSIGVEITADNDFKFSYSQNVFVSYIKENAIDISEEYDETDTDGDGLPDVWEIYGITYNGEFLDLPAMGADPNRKDIFVEIDYQSNFDLSNMQMFFDMVCSQYDKHDINLHIDAGFSSIDFVTGEIWGNMTGSNPISGTVWINHLEATPIATWKKLIDDNFNNIPIRSLVFRHCIFGEDIVWDLTTKGQVTGQACLPGQYMFIAYGSFFNKLSYNNEYYRNYDIALTFMHELGHTLGLYHGGIDETGRGDNTNHKPNYLSIMNYSFNQGGLRFYDDIGGFNYYNSDAMNYSEYDLPELNEWNLNENDGIDPNDATTKGIASGWYVKGNMIYGTEPISKAKVDFNGDNEYEDHIIADINNDLFLTTLKATTNDWKHIVIKTKMIGQHGTDLNIFMQQFMSDENEFEIAEEEPVPFEHSHSYLSSWNKDANFHWHECSCGDKIDVTSHISNNGEVTIWPTATSNGVKTYSCTICGYTIKTETVSATGTSGPGNNSSYPSNNSGSTNSNQSTSLNGNNTNTDNGESSHGEDISSAAVAYEIGEQVRNAPYARIMIIISMIGVFTIILKKRIKVHK